MDQSPRLSLSYLMPAQAQKHVTVNETFRRLDQLVQQTVLSRTAAAEPGAPNDGDAYILPASPTGTAWATFAQNNIAAYQDGAWTQITVAEGFSAWVAPGLRILTNLSSMTAQPGTQCLAAAARPPQNLASIQPPIQPTSSP